MRANFFIAFLVVSAGLESVAAAVTNSGQCEAGFVCKAVARAKGDYRGTSRLESSLSLAEAGARNACRAILTRALPTVPVSYCDGEVDIAIVCEEVRVEVCSSGRILCRATHWNGGENLGTGRAEISRFLAEASAIKECRKGRGTDQGYPAHYCESQATFQCRQTNASGDLLN